MEMEKEVKIKSICKYNGHSVRTNKTVDVSFKFAYDELVNYIQTIQMLNNDVSVYVRIGDEKPKPLGTFRIKELKIDGDGEGVLKLVSSIDFVEANNINDIVVPDAFNVMIVAKIEIEETPDEDGDDDWDDDWDE